MTDNLKQAIKEQDGDAAKQASKVDGGSCCSFSCCATAETVDPPLTAGS